MPPTETRQATTTEASRSSVSTYIQAAALLHNMSLDHLVRLNRDVVRTIKDKRAADSTLAMAALQIGDRVRVNLGPRSDSRYHGQTGVVIKFGRTNVTIRLDLAPLGSTRVGLLRVPAACLIKTAVHNSPLTVESRMIDFGHYEQPERAARNQE
jgi:ribosomal protein L21E